RYKFEAANADWTIRLKVENVLDERYYESGEFYPGDAGYLAYGAPVGATLSLQVDF
ncbi:MAG: TonB-dependent receptor, partial [Verrucomicrobiaceae bacterium]